MIHAFRLGPVSLSPPSYAFVAAFPSGKREVRYAPADAPGLVALREAVGEQQMNCEPALAEAAGRLGMAVAPLPPEVLAAKAVLAYELASGMEPGAARPDAIGALLKAAGAFWASKAWELIDTEEQLHAAFAWGRVVVQGELTVQAADRSQPRLVLCDEPALLDTLHGLAGGDRVAALLKGAGLTIELTREPAWAGAAIEEAFRLPRVPMPERRRGGRVGRVSTQDLLTAAVLLECVVAFADRGDGSEAEAAVEAGTLRVKARVGPTPPDASGLESGQAEPGLTPVSPEEDLTPAPAPAPTPTPTPTSTSTSTSAVADPPLPSGERAGVRGAPAPAPPVVASAIPPDKDADGLTPEELAAIVAGGDEKLSKKPPPADDAEEAPAAGAPVVASAIPPDKDADGLTPEELAAIVAGGDEKLSKRPPPGDEAEEAPVAGAPVVASAIPPDKDADGLTPEELAAIVAGGDEKLSKKPPPADEAEEGSAAEAAPPPDPEDEALSPEELAALMSGGGEPTSPEPVPSLEPEPVPEPAAETDAPLSPAELAALMKGGDSPPPAAPMGLPVVEPPAAPPAEEPPAATAELAEEEKPLSPAELAALMKGAAPTPVLAEAPPSPAASSEPVPAVAAPTPLAQITLTPEAPAEPDPAAEPPPPAVDAAPAETQASAETQVQGPGWMTKAWRALGASLRRAPKEARGGAGDAGEEPAPAPAPPPAPAPKPKPAPKPAAKAPPAAPRAPRPPTVPEAPLDPSIPFAPFARALQIPVPLEPLPVAPAEAEAAAALAKTLAAGAVGREHFVSFPAVALQIIEVVHGPKADARSVAGFISRDPGLAADVLAVANSAAFRGISEVGSVRDAVARLGLQEVGRVASAVSARALLLTAQPGGGPPSTRLFTRAVAVATVASATALQVRGAHSDQVWLAGLLHDVGLALGASALQRLAAAGGPPTPVLVGERAVELAHVEIGAQAMRAWGLPAYLAEVCARHHEEGLPAGPAQVDLHLVRITSALARLSEPEVAARAAEEIMQSAKGLGFDEHAVRALAADLKAAEKRAVALVR